MLDVIKALSFSLDHIHVNSKCLTGMFNQMQSVNEYQFHELTYIQVEGVNSKALLSIPVGLANF